MPEDTELALTAFPVKCCFIGPIYTQELVIAGDDLDKVFTALVKDNEALKKVGAKRVLVCDSRWSSAEWEYFIVEEYPDIETYRKYIEAWEEMGGFRFWKLKATLGIKFPVE